MSSLGHYQVMDGDEGEEEEAASAGSAAANSLGD